MDRNGVSLGRALHIAALSAACVFPLVAGGPPPIPNSTRYRGANSPYPAKGRAGTARLEARAMLAKDDTTLIELSTGQLDSSATPPGNISKVQLKGFDAAGTLRYTKNYNDLTSGGYLSYTYSDLLRHQPLQVQTNIRAIDGKRTDVVTVKTTVVRRPDLEASGLGAPAQAVKGAVVNISATLRELNHDLGATTNCVLYVDGTEVDRAEGLWVDAGGTVSVAFSHAFDTLGTHQIEVRAEGVTPGDWDSANNAVSGSIEIVSPVVRMAYYATMHDYDFAYRYRNHGGYGDGTYANDWASNQDQTGFEQRTWMSVYTPHAVTFPLTSLEVEETSDGTPVARQSYELLSADYGWSSNDGTTTHSWQTASQFDSASSSWLYLQTQRGVDNASGTTSYGNTYGYHQRYAGAVTYHSYGYANYWYGGSQYYGYTWNYENTSSSGFRAPVGERYGIRMTILDGATTYEARSEMSLQPFQNQWGYPWSCYSGNWYGYYSWNCYEYNNTQNGKYGSIWGQ